jgi:SAM-dependent MidA family methyltransferase
MQELVEKIRSEIRSRGAIPFHDFMQMALYCPVYGYYEKEADKIGRSGDFYTSVSVGPLFGQLLAYQFAEWLECPEMDCSVQIVEAGAHDGTLARDILLWVRQYRPALFDRLEYWIVEPSNARRSRQAQTLASFQRKVQWTEALPATVNTQHATRNTPFSGVIFSNELLDAMPFHRLRWDAKARRWFEWGVTWAADTFDWVRLTHSGIDDFAPKVPSEVSDVFLDGFTTEVCPNASKWWQDAASSLARGRLVAIDYGLEAEEFLQPERAGGTARAYRGHQLVSDLLADPGEQDITAHVNLSDLTAAGESRRLKTELLTTQTRFLTGIFAKASSAQSQFGEWTEKQTRQFQTLTHPDHLGRAFRVLVQQGEGTV